MSSKVAHYLQEHLVGEVISATDARNYFATDGSIFQMAPALVVYPKNENDVRKAARFSWQLAERGRIVPLTARGYGTDQTGAAIGSGMIVVFPAHMNRVLELDNKVRSVTVEPGISYGKLQQTLFTHSKFLPPYPASLENSSLGGALANNVSGEKSVKYGDTLNYVKNLRLVLANGEVIETKRLSKRELNKKLGLATFEGEIYRSVDTLLEEQNELVQSLGRDTLTNNSGYNLIDIKQKDGSFDLTPLIVGSQGTLGIITEATLETEDYDPKPSLIVAHIDSLEYLQQAVLELRKLSNLPSAVEIIDRGVLEQVQALNPNHIKDIIKPPFPLFYLVVEFEGDKATKKTLKRAEKLLEKYTNHLEVVTETEQQVQHWKIRQSVNMLMASNEGLVKAIPLFDGAVPPDRLREYLEALYKLMSSNNLKPAIWGHVGQGSLYMRPRLNLGQVGDRQKTFRLLEAYSKIIISLNGTLSATAGDGRLKTPYLESMYGPEAYNLLLKIKKIFDPYNTMNPGVKFGPNLDDLKAIVRPEFNLSHLYNHLPRS